MEPVTTFEALLIFIAVFIAMTLLTLKPQKRITKYEKVSPKKKYKKIS